MLKGKILCRFEGVSSDFRSNTRSLGECLRAQQGPTFQPFFSIKKRTEDPDELKVLSLSALQKVY